MLGENGEAGDFRCCRFLALIMTANPRAKASQYPTNGYIKRYVPMALKLGNRGVDLAPLLWASARHALSMSAPMQDPGTEPAPLQPGTEMEQLSHITLYATMSLS